MSLDEIRQKKELVQSAKIVILSAGTAIGDSWNQPNRLPKKQIDLAEEEFLRLSRDLKRLIIDYFKEKNLIKDAERFYVNNDLMTANTALINIIFTPKDQIESLKYREKILARKL